MLVLTVPPRQRDLGLPPASNRFNWRHTPVEDAKGGISSCYVCIRQQQATQCFLKISGNEIQRQNAPPFPEEGKRGEMFLFFVIRERLFILCARGWKSMRSFPFPYADSEVSARDWKAACSCVASTEKGVGRFLLTSQDPPRTHSWQANLGTTDCRTAAVMSCCGQICRWTSSSGVENM